MATIEELSESWRANGVWKGISLLPFLEALAIVAMSTTYLSVAFAKPPDMLGIPFGFVLEVVLLGWAALGATVIWTTRSPAMATLAVTTTTLPAMLIQPLIPALILIMQNLSV